MVQTRRNKEIAVNKFCQVCSILIASSSVVPPETKTYDPWPRYVRNGLSNPATILPRDNERDGKPREGENERRASTEYIIVFRSRVSRDSDIDKLIKTEKLEHWYEKGINSEYQDRGINLTFEYVYQEMQFHAKYIFRKILKYFHINSNHIYAANFNVKKRAE